MWPEEQARHNALSYQEQVESIEYIGIQWYERKNGDTIFKQRQFMFYLN